MFGLILTSLTLTDSFPVVKQITKKALLGYPSVKVEDGV